MSIYNNLTTPATPCLISVAGDRFINFFSLSATQFPYNKIVDISQPTQYSSTWLYVGAKGDPYQINFIAFFETSALAHQWKYFLATSSGMLYNIYDIHGNMTPNQILISGKVEDERTHFNLNYGGSCYPGAYRISGTLDMQPQP
jgi:hypothetical protein